MSKNKRNVNTMLSRFLLIFSATILFAFITIISASLVFAQVVINEFVSNPSSGQEWVELYNPTSSSIDLAGWNLTQLTDPQGTPNEVELLSLSGILSAGGILAFDVGTSKLNDPGDSIGLYNGVTLIDSVTYGTVTDMTSNVTNPTTTQSAGRLPDGSNNFVIFNTPTKGTANGHATITSANPVVVYSSFTPEIGANLARGGATAFIGREAQYTGPVIGIGTPDTIKWKVTVTGPAALTPDMVDMDEVGFNDPPSGTSLGTFHYPFTTGSASNELVALGSCDAADTHVDTCEALVGFSLDANDLFKNADSIKFSPDAPLGNYIIKYELVDTATDMVLSNAFEVNVNVVLQVNIVSAAPTVVDASFTPQIGSELSQNVEAYLGRTSTYTGPTIGANAGGEDTLKWKVTIVGPEAFTADMVDLDEFGWIDVLNIPSTDAFHYPFQEEVSGTLVAVGSCDNILPSGHDEPDTCTTDIGFGLDENDVFTNADKIKFNSNAPSGTYTIKYELVDTATEPDNVLSNAYEVNVALTSTITVCSTCTFTTIQAAIDAANPGDTINVAAGTYTESLAINKGVTLQGAGRDVTTITGAQTITASNVTVDGFTLNGGITLNDAANSISGGTISNNLITGAQYGIRIGSTATGFGVNNVTIDGNTITANTKRGILFYNRADYAAQGVSNVTINGNEITNNTDGGVNGGGISTYGPGPNTITNNIVTGNNGNGISIKYDDGDTVTGNTVSNNTAMGINMHQVTNSIVENNTISGQVSTAVVTTFWGGSITAGKGSAIYVHEASHDNTIRLNTLTDNKIGILINRESAGNDPSGNSLNNNKITGNTVYGILNALVSPSTSTNAENNWWGSASGPTHTSNPSGTGGSVSDHVDFIPWCTDETCVETFGGVTISSSTDFTIDATTFEPVLGNELVRNSIAYYSVNSESSIADSIIDVQWKITIESPEGFTPIMVDLDEVGWEDILNEPSTTIFHYPFNESLITIGSCSDPIGTYTLEATGTPGNESRVTIQASDVGISTLNDFNTMSWDAIVNSGYLPHVDVLLDINENGVYDSGVDDALVFEYAKVDPSIGCDEGIENYPTGNLNTFGIKGIVDNDAKAWLTSGPAGGCASPATEFFWHSLNDWKEGVPTNEANGKTIDGNTKVLRLELEVDNWIADSNSEVSNIQVNSVLQAPHDNECTTDSFDVDPSDVFTNIDKINFSLSAPTGVYTLTRQLVDANGNSISNQLNISINVINNEGDAVLPSSEEGQAELPEGETEMELDDDTVLDLSSNVNTADEDGFVTVGGEILDLNDFTSGDLDDEDLTEEKTIGDQTVIVAQAVKLESGVNGTPINFTNANLSGVSVSIPDGTTVLAPSGWDGTIQPPKAGSSSGTAPSGFSVGGTVIEVGSPDVVLLFDTPLTILLNGVTGSVGYKPAGSSTWVQITNVCGGTFDNPTNPTFPGECFISNGIDTKIVTYHFTSFGSLNPTPSPAPSGGGAATGGGGGGGGVAYSWQCGEWSECSSQGIQTRSCSLATGSGGSSSKPAETQTCTYTAPAPAVEEAQTSAAPTTPASAPAVTTTAQTAPTGAAVAPPTGLAKLTGAFISDLNKPSTWIGIIVAVLAVAGLYAGYSYLYKKKR